MPDLREQIIFALARREGLNPEAFTAYTRSSRWGKTADAVLAVFAERERDLRERIEAMPSVTAGQHVAPWLFKADVLAALKA